MSLRIGVDLGGTKIEAVVVELGGEAPLERARARVATNRALGYEHVLAETRALVIEVAREAGVDPRATPIGVGMPGGTTTRRSDGTPSDVPLVKNSNTTCLNGQPFRSDLAAALGLPIAFANDANCFALSEAADGAGAGADVVFGVILGTGVGGGIVVRGRVLDGPNGIAGEWGHDPLPWPRDDERPGPPCFCGKDGCIETFLSGPGLAGDHRRATGTALAPAAIVEAAAAGDPACEATLARYEERLARALAHVVNLLDPDVVVLGGGLSNLDRLYASVPRLWGRWVFSDRVDTKLEKNRHGDSSGVRGAAWLWPPPEGGVA